MSTDKAGHDLRVGRDGLKGDFLIVVYETTVALNIGTEDGGKFAFEAFGVHEITR
jgi:hypothetical protein